MPRNGALDAAVSVLSTCLPRARVEAAARLLTPALLRLLRHQGMEDLQSGMALVRLLDASPAVRARREAAVSELRGAGLPVPPLAPEDDPTARVARFVELCGRTGATLDTGLALLKGLRRKFPAADGAALLEASEALFAAWAPFEDWMGAVSLLRALPTQRELSLERFTVQLTEWLATEDDLFDALRAFTRLEGRGARPVGEVLALLRTGES